MVLHITHDDKFIDFFIARAKQQLNDVQRFVIYVPVDGHKLKFVKNQEVLIASLYSEAFNKIVGDLSSYRTIYIHYLSKELLKFISSIPKGIKVVWIFWGADVFDLPDFRNGHYLENTSSVLNREEIPQSWVAKGLFRLKTIKKKHYESLDLRQYQKAINRVDFFAHYIYEDYQIIKNYFKADFNYIDFTYGTVEQFTFPLNPDTAVGETNVLIGNSANPANNHLDAIQLLSDVHLEHSKVYVPLSYSGSEEYISQVISGGKRILGDKFTPLLDFLMPDEYHAILKSVGFAIMPHKRSQAWGNIIALLWIGVKVFMCGESNLYKLLNCLGFKIYALDEIDEISFNSLLTSADRSLNQSLLLKHFGEEKSNERYHTLLTI
ncbi:TDP-N-acetylfucosamine:lipid II N-acetylfucosaminyltransferase [Nafulsella turpanensis]|uniref:TDP-N-acetylfucosamine:lipid II N-acetylfucosaminyltransferase n=1 Tax=Nafulsella turpanensis TaxID=1265690 RepID=UPI0003470298|nr:TDP-N-acetylfucosamine:lipid II N-acetylfucosaminyltransferase [Nafulsella turpanensis]